jgi:hypothetical protein
MISEPPQETPAPILKKGRNMSKKMVVEDCISIKIAELVHHGFVHADAVTTGKYYWGSQPIAATEVDCTVAEPFARFTYAWNEEPEKRKEVE